MTHLRGQVSRGLDRGLDALHRALVGGADGSGLLCCGAQLVGVVLKVGGPVFKDLRVIKAAWLRCDRGPNEREGRHPVLTSSLLGASSGAVAATARSLMGVVVSLKMSDTSWVIASCIFPLRSWEGGQSGTSAQVSVREQCRGA